MTAAEGKDRLVEFVQKKVDRSGFFIFFKRDITLTLTRILEPYEKTANLPLPQKIQLVDIELDQHGILYHREEFIDWNEVCATGIMSEYVRNKSWEPENSYNRHLLVILHSGDIIPFEIGDIAHFKGLLGHFVELYKTGKQPESFAANPTA